MYVSMRLPMLMPRRQAAFHAWQVPDGAWGSNLCIVDSCNYRMQIVSPHDGALLRTVGRPGARFGELSSPSSIAHDPSSTGRGGRPVVFASSNVGPEDRRVMAFDLDTAFLAQLCDYVSPSSTAAPGRVYEGLSHSTPYPSNLRALELHEMLCNKLDTDFSKRALPRPPAFPA